MSPWESFFSWAILRSIRVCSVTTFPVLNMATPFRLSKRLRRLRELLSARSISCFTKARNHQNCRTSPSENPRMTLLRTHLIYRSGTARR